MVLSPTFRMSKDDVPSFEDIGPLFRTCEDLVDLQPAQLLCNCEVYSEIMHFMLMSTGGQWREDWLDVV